MKQTTQTHFRAVYVSTRDSAAELLENLEVSSLPAGDVMVAVHYSSLNYKDALAISGRAPVVRTFPMVPGIDCAGVVLTSTHPSFQLGDEVICTGRGLGETRWGGLAERACVEGDWLIALPKTLTMRSSMAIGTAGLTAMLGIIALERQGLPPASAVVVTGAAGGVGGMACRLLSRLGHHVSAVTGRMQESDYLRSLGAHEIIPRSNITAHPERSLLNETWAGGIDAVGGDMLAGLLRHISHGGAVATCGMAAGGQLPTTVYPFILRAVSLLGIASGNAPSALRHEAWARMANLLHADEVEAMTRTITLSEVIAAADELLAGRVRGRLLVRVDPTHSQN